MSMRSLSVVAGFLWTACGVAVGEEALTFDILQKQAAQALEAKSRDVVIVPPTLKIQDGTAYLELGGLVRQAETPTPLAYPLESAYSIALMKRTLAPEFNYLNWRGAFEQAEKIGEEQLQHIREQRDDPEKLLETLEKDRARFEDAFVKTLPVSNQVQAVRIVPPAPSVFHHVTVTCKPAKGGVAYYLPKLEYELLQRIGAIGDDRLWNQVPMNRTVRIGGKYRFRGRWPESDPIDTGIYQIDADEAILLELPAKP